MSLLLEALKRAERAKRQLPAEESRLATESVAQEETSTPPADETAPALQTLDLSGLEAFEATQAKAASAPTEKEAATAQSPEPDTATAADSDQKTVAPLEFILEPFDLPEPAPATKPAEENGAPLPSIDWSEVALNQPAAVDTTPPVGNDDEVPADLPVIETVTAPVATIALAEPATSAASTQANVDVPLNFVQPVPLSAETPPQAPESAIFTDSPLGKEPTLSSPLPTEPEPESSPSPVSLELETVKTAAVSPSTPAESTKAPASPAFTETAPPQKPASASRLEEAREKARRLLGKPAPAVPDQQPGKGLKPRQKTMLALLIGSILIGAGGGLYVYREISGGGSSAVLRQGIANNGAPIPAAMPAGSPQSDTTPAPGAAPATTLPTPPLPDSRTDATATKNGNEKNLPTEKTAAEIAPQPSAPAGPISIVRNPPRVDVLDDAVRQGYAAYERGDYNTARTHYQRAVKADGRNRQALLGLAATEEAGGNKAQASNLYIQVLSLDPRDTVAQAALLNASSSDPIQGESRLRLLLNEQPDRAFLHFALGNALAAQNRWPEAEHAYFRAAEIESNNPDYAFNLAISLDQLHQWKPARDQYQRALDLATKKPARFDREVARQRLEKLSSQP